jgi:opacity protein-like surface antigen
LSFDIYVGDFLRLNIHDRFAIVQNPVDEIALANTARFDRFQNAAGITAFFDLNDLQIVLGYDHFDYRTFDDKFDFIDRREEQLFTSVSTRLSDALTVGIDGSFAWVDHITDFNNDGTTWSAGPFVEAQLSPYSRLRVAGGYQGMDWDGSGENGDTDDYGGWYANAALSQRLNRYWSHVVSVGHESRVGLAVNFAEYTFARYVATWQVNTRTAASFDAFVEDANESGTDEQFSERAFRWGIGAGISRRLGENLSVALHYRFVDKDSDLPLRSYYQNIGLLQVGWDF